MADFTRENLAGSRFEEVDLTGARFRNVYLTGAVIRGAVLVNVEIDGLIQDVTVNGVDVVPRCATSSSPPTPGSAARSWASRRPGIRWACRTTRCPVKPLSRGTGTPGRRWTRCSRPRPADIPITLLNRREQCDP